MAFRLALLWIFLVFFVERRAWSDDFDIEITTQEVDGVSLIKRKVTTVKVSEMPFGNLLTISAIESFREHIVCTIVGCVERDINSYEFGKIADILFAKFVEARPTFESVAIVVDSKFRAFIEGFESKGFHVYSNVRKRGDDIADLSLLVKHRPFSDNSTHLASLRRMHDSFAAEGLMLDSIMRTCFRVFEP